jgi:uncharacterized membrane protein YkoI
MKKQMLWVTLITLTQLINYGTYAQVVNVPKKSKEDLAKKYPKAEGISWSNDIVYYIAKFTQNGNEYHAHYNMDGTYNYTSQPIPFDKIPEKAKTSFKNSRFEDWKVLSVSRIEHGKDEPLYRIEVKKGIEKKYVYFNAEGKEVKSSLAI